jgi:hypothetical protein
MKQLGILHEERSYGCKSSFLKSLWYKFSLILSCVFHDYPKRVKLCLGVKNERIYVVLNVEIRNLTMVKVLRHTAVRSVKRLSSVNIEAMQL